jgi:hypothetical protein
MDPRAGLDDVEQRKFLNLPGPELRLLSRLACSQSIYRLLYPGSNNTDNNNNMNLAIKRIVRRNRNISILLCVPFAMHCDLT